MANLTDFLRNLGIYHNNPLGHILGVEGVTSCTILHQFNQKYNNLIRSVKLHYLVPVTRPLTSPTAAETLNQSKNKTATDVKPS